MSKTRKPQHYAGFKVAAEKQLPKARKPLLPADQAWAELLRRRAARGTKS